MTGSAGAGRLAAAAIGPGHRAGAARRDVRAGLVLAARFKPERGPARAWLFGIAQHLLFGYYRRLEVEDRARKRLGVVLEPALDDDADARLTPPPCAPS